MAQINIDEIRTKMCEMSYHELNLAQSQAERDRNNARANRDYPRIQACKDLMRDIDKLRHSPVRMTDVKLPPQQQRPTPPAKPRTVAKPVKPGKPIPAPRVLQQVRDGVQGEQPASEEREDSLPEAEQPSESSGEGAKQERQAQAPPGDAEMERKFGSIPSCTEAAGPEAEALGPPEPMAPMPDLPAGVDRRPPPQALPEYVSPRTVKILKAHTVPQLREMCGAVKLSPGGNKAELIARLMNESTKD